MKFNSALGYNRSQCLTRLRTEAHKIFDIKALSSLMSASKANKSKSKSKAAVAASEPLPKSSLPAVQNLLRDKKGNLDHTSRFPAVFYPTHSDFNVSDLFTNPSLFKVWKLHRLLDNKVITELSRSQGLSCMVRRTEKMKVELLFVATVLMLFVKTGGWQQPRVS